MNQENKEVRSIHYLGSKLRMLEAIENALNDVIEKPGAICDLFSGSGTVTKYLLHNFDVISVDIQEYSKVLCEASTACLKFDTAPHLLVQDIKEQQATQNLNNIFSQLISYENECSLRADKGELKNLYEIIEFGSLYILEHENVSGISQKFKNILKNTIIEIKGDTVLSLEDSMISRYYGGLYFSYKQAVDMDCIAHWVFEQEGVLKTKALAALLSTASDLVNTVGKQFAQPLKIRNSKGELKQSLLTKIQKDRKEDAYVAYEKWLKYYLSIGEMDHRHTALCDDYVSALSNLKSAPLAAIYADPPYTRYHYSRYYHVLETICLRDNPKVSTTFPNGKGGISRAIYRVGRHQSPFCVKSEAEKAFDLLFQKASELDVPLVLSYSPFDPSKAVTPRLQTIDQLVEKAKQYYSSVTIVSPGEFTHSKLNSSDKNFESNHEAELLIVCKN